MKKVEMSFLGFSNLNYSYGIFEASTLYFLALSQIKIHFMLSRYFH
jgi:hypothetical protein